MKHFASEIGDTKYFLIICNFLWFYPVISVIYTRKYCDNGNRNGFRDFDGFTRPQPPPECEKWFSVWCLYVYVYAPCQRMNGFYSYLTFKSFPIIGGYPVNMNSVAQEVGPITQNFCFLENSSQRFWLNFTDVWRRSSWLVFHRWYFEENNGILSCATSLPWLIVFDLACFTVL
jgi:hypothetical protein